MHKPTLQLVRCFFTFSHQLNFQHNFHSTWTLMAIVRINTWTFCAEQWNMIDASTAQPPNRTHKHALSSTYTAIPFVANAVRDKNQF